MFKNIADTVFFIDKVLLSNLSLLLYKKKKKTTEKEIRNIKIYIN